MVKSKGQCQSFFEEILSKIFCNKSKQISKGKKHFKFDMVPIKKAKSTPVNKQIHK